VDLLEHHPVKKFLDMGLLVTINSDNMTVSNTNVFREISLAKEKLGLTQQDIEKLVSNAVHISFADDETKEMLKKEIFYKKRFDIQ
jgi:adenosine deaminase